MPQNSLILYLKSPIEGSVKTRLAKRINASNALRVYQSTVEGQIQRIPDSVTTEIHYTPADELPLMQQWLGSNLHFVPQADGDLGKKLSHSFQSVFAGGADNCLCIGGDCPALSEAHISEALNALDQGADAVFGPCFDGGYYLVGLKNEQPELFRDIPWSSPDTLGVTLHRAQTLGLKIHLLESLYDVDDLPTLKRAIDEGYLSKSLLPSYRTVSQSPE